MLYLAVEWIVMVTVRIHGNDVSVIHRSVRAAETREERMTQMDLLVTNVAELLAGAVHEVLRLMGQAVSEYREESARIHQENQKLQRMLEELRNKLQVSGTTAHWLHTKVLVHTEVVAQPGVHIL